MTDIPRVYVLQTSQGELKVSVPAGDLTKEDLGAVQSFLNWTLRQAARKIGEKLRDDWRDRWYPWRRAALRVSGGQYRPS